MTRYDGELMAAIWHGDPCRYLRYNDGEWACMLGLPGMNCDKTPYTPELRAALNDSLTSAIYHGAYIGIGQIAYNHFAKGIADAIRVAEMRAGVKARVCDADLFHRLVAHRPHLMDATLSMLPRPLLVAPDHYHQRWPYEHLACPQEGLHERWKPLAMLLAKIANGRAIILSCGMTAAMIGLQMPDDAIVLDLGSAMMPYADPGHTMRIRSWQRRLHSADSE